MSEEKKELPDYIKETADGDYDVSLRRPIKIDGASIGVLRMREPTVNDNLVQEATKGSDSLKEMTTFANLCSVTIEDIKLLKLHDYRRVQEAFANFII